MGHYMGQDLKQQEGSNSCQVAIAALQRQRYLFAPKFLAHKDKHIIYK